MEELGAWFDHMLMTNWLIALATITMVILLASILRRLSEIRGILSASMMIQQYESQWKDYEREYRANLERV